MDQPTLVTVSRGEPIGWPVEMGGPSVMNSQAEIAPAYRDLHAGKFGDVARQPA